MNWLLDQPPVDYSAFLEQHLPYFDTAEQDEIATCLKGKADHFRRACLDQSFQIVELMKTLAELTGNDLHYGLALRAEGNAYALGMGECQKGIDAYEEAANIYQRKGLKLEEAWSKIGMIIALANLGRSDEALAIGAWAQDVFRELEEWLPLAELMVNMAIIQGRLGRDKESLELIDQARSLYVEYGMEGTDKRLAVVDMNRSILLRNLGRFDEAIRINQEIIETYMSQGNAVAAARSQINLALTYIALSRYNETLTLLDVAQQAFINDGQFQFAFQVEVFTSKCLLQLRRFNDALGKCRHARQHFNDPIAVGESLLIEARALIGLGQYDEALSSLHEARKLFQSQGELTAQADTDLYIAKVLLDQNHPEEALSLTQASLAVFEENYLTLGQSQALIFSALAALSLNRLGLAKEMVADVLTIAADHNLPTFTHQGLHLAGTIAAQTGDFQQALEYWESGIDALEQIYGHLMLEYRPDFAQDKMRLYEDIVALYMCQDNPASALNFAERAKSRALHDLLAYRLNLRIEARSKADQQFVDELLALRDERNHLYLRWQSNDKPGELEGIVSELSSKQTAGQQMIALEQQITDVWHKLLVRNAAYAQDADLWQIRTEPVQPFLDDKTALVEYFLVRDQFVAFVITSDAVQAISLDMTLQQTQQLLQLFGLNLRRVPYSSPGQMAALTKNIQGVLHKLYQGLFEFVHPLLNGFERLIVVPHGPLHYLPFHALFDGQAYLLEQFEMSYLPSSSLLKYCQTAEKVDGGILAMGYSSDGRLPHAAQEAQTIAENWQGQFWVEEEATLTNFHDHAGNNRILHLATHGEFRPDNPLFSGLIMADGWLTTLDIFNLRLKASLVTLSACQTGRSVVGGGDELLGLLRAFLAAGAASLVSTFWSVEDTTTAQLMNDFYQALACGDPKGTALRKAQLKFVSKHPYFWSPFFLVGDTGPL